MNVILPQSCNTLVLHDWGSTSIALHKFNAVAMQSLRFSLQPLSAATSAPGISADRLRKARLNQQLFVINPLLFCLTPWWGSDTSIFMLIGWLWADILTRPLEWWYDCQLLDWKWKTQQHTGLKNIYRQGVKALNASLPDTKWMFKSF